MYERIEKCPSCSHIKYTNRFIIQDYAVSQESFAIVECDQCNFLFTNPRPTQVEIHKYYESKNYYSHTTSKQNLHSILYSIFRNIQFSYKLKSIRKFTNKTKLLDVGSGNGFFANKMKRAGYTVSTIENNENALASQYYQGMEKPYTNLESLPKEKYDVITLWHVLEHLPDLHYSLKKLKKRLHKDGYLYIAVPNAASPDAEEFGEHWAGYDIPRHFYHFTPTTLRTVLKNNKLKIIYQFPMYYDAYYVSLLSHTYKNNKFPLLRAVLSGFKSNTSAKKSGLYSSIIYVIVK